MGDAGELTEVERLLLMAAAAHRLGPDTPLRANSATVVGQALRWARLADDEVRAAWEAFEYCPAIARFYGALIRMTRRLLREGVAAPERPGEALFEGAGNFGTPDDPQAFPHFTACRLTARGVRVAEHLLQQHPEYRKSGEPGAAEDGGGR